MPLLLNALDGILVGNAKIIDDPERGKVLNLDGSGSYVDCGNNWLFDITGSITVSAWVKVGKFDKQWQAIVTKGDTAWRLQRDKGESFIEFACSGVNVSGARLGNLSGSANVNDGKWHHIVGKYDGSNIYLYVDGSLDGSKKASGYMRAHNFPVYVGENAEKRGRCWNGLIDDVRIYSYALSEEEIRALYEETAAKPEAVGNTSSEDP